MDKTRKRLENIFARLNQRIEDINQERRTNDEYGLPKATVKLLGQMSLFANEKSSAVLTLAQTADLDAFLSMVGIIQSEFEKILVSEGLIYDKFSHEIWIPPNSKFNVLFEFENLTIESIDPESALVSKAVKAPVKNKLLIREALASDQFPNLAERIIKAGGRLENFHE